MCKPNVIFFQHCRRLQMLLHITRDLKHSIKTDKLLVLIAFHLDIPCLLKYYPNLDIKLVFFFVHNWNLQQIISAVIFDLRFLGINVFGMFQFLNFLHFLQFRIQICLDSWVSIVISSILDDRGIMLKFWQLKEILCLYHHIRTGSGAHPTAYLMSMGGVFPRGKAARTEADHSYLSSTDIKNAWNYTLIFLLFFMVWCLIKYEDHFIILDLDLIDEPEVSLFLIVI